MNVTHNNEYFKVDNGCILLPVLKTIRRTFKVIFFSVYMNTHLVMPLSGVNKIRENNSCYQVRQNLLETNSSDREDEIICHLLHSLFSSDKIPQITQGQFISSLSAWSVCQVQHSIKEPSAMEMFSGRNESKKLSTCLHITNHFRVSIGNFTRTDG